jgi:hypothetical protein
MYKINGYTKDAHGTRSRVWKQSELFHPHPSPLRKELSSSYWKYSNFSLSKDLRDTLYVKLFRQITYRVIMPFCQLLMCFLYVIKCLLMKYICNKMVCFSQGYLSYVLLAISYNCAMVWRIIITSKNISLVEKSTEEKIDKTRTSS